MGLLFFCELPPAGALPTVKLFCLVNLRAWPPVMSRAAPVLKDFVLANRLLVMFLESAMFIVAVVWDEGNEPELG